MTESLYIHIPFCKSICFYCDFCHQIYQRETAVAYLNALQKELAYRVSNFSLKTIYIGGGTPSVLEEDCLESLLTLLDPYTKEVEEYTIEVNPETLTESKIQLFKAHGINRISMGLQTSNEKELSSLNRHHTYEEVKKCISLLRNAGISNISLDLMYGLPGQTKETLQKSLTDTIALEVPHISIYSLTIEENSVFGRRGVQPMDSDEEADRYEEIVSTLAVNGYRQYEISNFTKGNQPSKHNLAYWHYDDFFGIGAGSSGKEGSMRYDHTRNINAYIANPCAMEPIVLSETDIRFEAVMMGLRLKEGISLEQYKKKYGVPLESIYVNAIETNQKRGWLEIHDGYLRCTSKGYPLLNEVLEEFL